ncbi:MAG: YaiI/YqxD family protein [Anaeroplasmataceae bacterium]
MRILVDADACPVVRFIEKIAKNYNIEVILFYDTSHNTTSDYSQIITVDKGMDSVDFALINKVKKGDIVVSQDYGVATMALSKNAYAINQNGLEYTNDNINYLLESRSIIKKVKNSNKKIHFKGPRKRTKEDDFSFEMELKKLIERVINND